MLTGGVMTAEQMEFVHHCPHSCVFSHIMSSQRSEHAIWTCVIGKEMFTVFVMGHHDMELSPVPFCCAVICRRHGTVLIWHFWFSQCCCWRFRSSGMWCHLVGSVAPQVAVDNRLEHQELLAQHTALHARRLYLILTCYFCCSVGSYVADIMSGSRMTNHRCVGCSQALV